MRASHAVDQAVRVLSLLVALSASACGVDHPSHGGSAGEDGGGDDDLSDQNSDTDAGDDDGEPVEVVPDAGPDLDDGGAGPDADAPDTGGACADVDDDGYGVGCALGADCDDGNANVHPGADDADWDSLDANCDGAPDPRFVQTGKWEGTRPLRFRAFDKGVFINVTDRLTAFRAPDFTTPIYDEPFPVDDLHEVELVHGTLVVRTYEDPDLRLFAFDDPTQAPIEKGRIEAENHAQFVLSEDGKRLYRLRVEDYLYVVDIWDLEDRAAPKLVGTVETSCLSLGSIDVQGDRLMVRRCSLIPDQPSPFGFYVYDVSSPAQPEQIAYGSVYDSQYVLGIADEKVYLQQVGVSRFPLIVDGPLGLADKEMLDVPLGDFRAARTQTIRKAGLYYVETSDYRSTPALCRMNPDGLVPTCFTELVRPDELLASYSLFLDGDDLLIVGSEFVRHVDVSNPAQPVVGERALFGLGPYPVYVGTEYLVGLTNTGVATLDPETLDLRDFAPLDRDAMYAAASDGEHIYALSRDGRLSVVQIGNGGTLSLSLSSQRSFLNGAMEAQVATRGSQQYLVVRTEKVVYSALLDGHGGVGPYNPLGTYRTALAIADNGEKLFAAVEDNDGAEHIVTLELDGSVNPAALSYDFAQKGAVNLAANAERVFFTNFKLYALELANASASTVDDSPNVLNLCQGAGEIFAFGWADEYTHVVVGSKLHSVGIENLTQMATGDSWMDCVGNDERLVLRSNSHLVSVKRVQD